MATPKQSVLIIEARFYGDIADELAKGAIAHLESEGMAYERLAVPGALEIPLALAIAVENGLIGARAKHQGCVALGCVIRGETSHYDIVAGESARALMTIAAQHALPLGNGILTVENREQAQTRASAGGRNKGAAAAAACLALMRLARETRAGA